MIFKREEYKLLKKVVLGRVVFKPPFKATEAFQDEARIVHVINGNSKLYVPNTQFDISDRDSFVMKCDSFVNEWLENEGDEPTEVLIVKLYPEVLKYIYDNKMPDIFISDSTKSASPVQKIQHNQSIGVFVESLRHYFDNDMLTSEDLVKLKVKELIHILVKTDTSGELKVILGDLFRTNEYEFKDVINAHLFEDLKLDDLAFLTGLSLSSFKRKFKMVFQTSPKQYINHKRLEKSKFLLETTSLRISEIAYDCGFNDVAYFSKIFNSEFESSPSDFRKNLSASS